ncbi:MAG: YceI family protein [Anaeromyxobacter sp.]
MTALPLLLPLALAAGTGSATLRSGPGDGKVVMRVYKKGLFSPFAHDHAFQPGRWSATAELPDGDPARARVAVRIDARTLEDHAEGLSEADRRKVSGQARGADLLDVERHPEITWRCEGLELDAPGEGGARKGTAHGQLALHGQERPLDLAVEATPDGPGWRVKARGRIRQSGYGIRPFSSMGGALAVKDQVDIEVDLVLRPER